MTTEKMRVSASSVMSNVDETRPTPMRWRGVGCVGIARECTIRHHMGWRPAAFRRAFLAAAIGWAIALPFATFVASRPHVSSGPYLFALSVYLTGRTICHRLAGRLFALWGLHMPVCARCSGIFLAVVFVALIG